MEKKNLLKRISSKLVKMSGFRFQTIKNRILVSAQEKGFSGAQLVNNRAFTSLRAIHSIFRPISVSIELKSKRRGGRVFLVPVPVKSDKRRYSVFIR